MMLTRLLLDRRADLWTRWRQQLFADYPQDGRSFLADEHNAFANPVGHTLSEATRALLDLLLGSFDRRQAEPHLEAILRLRAVQELRPSEALSFLPLLKTTVREVLGDELHEPAIVLELSAFEARVDELLLCGFDIYSRCREAVFKIRVREAQRSVSGLLRRFGVVDPADVAANADLVHLRRSPSSTGETP
jgi:hypothetical protein